VAVDIFLSDFFVLVEERNEDSEMMHQCVGVVKEIDVPMLDVETELEFGESMMKVQDDCFAKFLAVATPLVGARDQKQDD